MLKFGGSPKFHKTKFPFITRFSNFEGSTLTCHQIHKLRAPELPSYIVVNHIHISEGWVKKQSKCNFLFFFPMGAIWPPPGSPCYLKTSGGIGLSFNCTTPRIFNFPRCRCILQACRPTLISCILKLVITSFRADIFRWVSLTV